LTFKVINIRYPHKLLSCSTIQGFAKQSDLMFCLLEYPIQVDAVFSIELQHRTCD